MQRGRFITIEGQDGAGKSTNLAVLEQCLQEQNIDFIKTREPGGTALGESIRSLVLNSNDQQFGAQAELLLIFAARAQHLSEVIKPALARGVWVVCDRFSDATYAYQGAGRELDVQAIAWLERYVQDDLQPDLTLLLDLPVQMGENRAGQRSAPDRFELQQQSFKQRVRQCYLERAKQYSARIKVIDASQSIEQVAEQINHTMQQFLPTLHK